MYFIQILASIISETSQELCPKTLQGAYGASPPTHTHTELYRTMPTAVQK